MIADITELPSILAARLLADFGPVFLSHVVINLGGPAIKMVVN